MKHKLTDVCLWAVPLLWALLTLFGCGKADPVVTATLNRADSLMNVYPDSAYRMLLDLRDKADEQPASLRMRHLLLLGNAQNKADIPFTSDSLGRALVEYYRDHGTTNERVLAHYVRGCAYRDMEDWPSAVRCFNDAIAAADTTAVDCDFLQLCIIYGQLAKVFDKQYLPEEALEAYRKAECYAPDTFAMLNLRDHMSTILFRKGDIQQGLELKESLSRASKERGDYPSAAIFKVKCIKWYARQGEFDKAKEAMEDYERHSGFFLPNGDIEPGRQDYYYIKGIYYEEKGNMDSAEHYFRKLQRLATNVNSQYLSANGLTRVYRSRHITDSIAKYAWEAFITYDSLYSQDVAQNLQMAQARYNYERHRQLAYKKEMEAKESRIWLQNVVIVCTVLLSMIVVVVMVYRRRVQIDVDKHVVMGTFRRQANFLVSGGHAIRYLSAVCSFRLANFPCMKNKVCSEEMP